MLCDQQVSLKDICKARDLTQGQHASKKLPFSGRVVNFSFSQPLAIILHQVPARGILLLQNSTRSKGRCNSQEVGWKIGVKKAEDWG